MNKCDMVNDLLPLYADNMLSETSRDFVERHLKTCTSCAEKARKLSAPLPDTLASALPPPDKDEETRTVKRIKRKFSFKALWISLTCLILCGVIVFFSVFLWFRSQTLYPISADDSEFDKTIMPAIEITASEAEGEILFTQQETGWGAAGKSVRFTLPEEYDESRLDDLQAKNLYISTEKTIYTWLMVTLGYDAESGWSFPNAELREELEAQGLKTYVEYSRFVMEYELSSVHLFSSTRDIRIASAVRTMKQFVSLTNVSETGRYYPVTGDLDGFITTIKNGDTNIWEIVVEQNSIICYLMLVLPAANTAQEQTVTDLLSSLSFVA